VEGRAVRWAADIREEMAAASSLMAVAHSNLRWPVESTISLADATPSAGGAVDCAASQDLAMSMYHARGYRGCHVRLDESVSHDVSRDPPQRPIASEVVACLPWRDVSIRSFAKTQHVIDKNHHQSASILNDGA
jgi:hypothetical protein